MDDEGEWLTVRYNGRTSKQLQRFCDDIRAPPVTPFFFFPFRADFFHFRKNHFHFGAVSHLELLPLSDVFF